MFASGAWRTCHHCNASRERGNLCGKSLVAGGTDRALDSRVWNTSKTVERYVRPQAAHVATPNLPGSEMQPPLPVRRIKCFRMVAISSSFTAKTNATNLIGVVREPIAAPSQRPCTSSSGFSPLRESVTRQVILVKNLSTGRGLANGSRGVVVRFATSTSSGARLPVVRFTSGLEEVIRCVPVRCRHETTRGVSSE